MTVSLSLPPDGCRGCIEAMSPSSGVGRSILIKRVAYLPWLSYLRWTASFFAGVEDYFDHMQGCSVVPRGRVVVLGDNRPNSEDSRHFGPVAMRDIIGKVIGSPSAP